MLDRLAPRYAWADRDYGLSWTFAVVPGCGRADAIRAHGGDPGQEHQALTFAEACVQDEEDFGVVSLVQAREERQHVLMIENNGWLGISAREIAQRASADGRDFIAVHWGVQSTPFIAQARDGQSLAFFEPLQFAIDPEQGSPTPRRQPPIAEGTYPDWLADTEFRLGSVYSTMLAIVEQQTGLAFDRAWLDEPMPTYRIPYPGAGATSGTPSPVMA